jgi:type IV pilus assembly protein PilM
VSAQPLLKKELSLRGSGRPKQKAATNGHRRLVGLKIGASQLAAATVSNNGGAELLQVAREPLAPGIVVGGELREPLALTEALQTFFKKHGLATRGVRLGIANNRIGVRTFDLPAVAPEHLENAILFRAQEALPIPVEDAVLDYHILDERFGETSPRVLLVVTYRELVDGFVGACRAAGLGLVGIDLEAFALLRALTPPPVSGKAAAAVVVVSIGHQRSTVAVTNGRSCELTRVIDWGGANLDVALARARGTTPGEAVTAKHALSLTSQDDAAEDQTGPAREATLKELHGFARQLASSLQFYQSQPGALALGEVVITGGTAHLPGLAPELERLLGAPVRVGDPLSRVTLGKKLRAPEQIGSLAVAIGLGIED